MDRTRDPVRWPAETFSIAIRRGKRLHPARALSSRTNLCRHIFKPMKYSYEELAKMIDHSLLHPTITDQEFEDGCKLAVKYGVASVCIKPYAVKRAVELLKGSGLLVGCVIGFPHGNSTTESKCYETEVACRDGAVEIDMVINIGKALSGDWDYVERDIKAVRDEAHARRAKVKVIFENDYLTNGGAGLTSDQFKRKLCEICENAAAD